MRQSSLLVVNTIVTYVRMALTVGLGVVATRLLTHALGYSDFGLSSVLGASSALLTVISDAFTGSTQRHMAYEIGRGDTEHVGIVFNTSLVLFVAMGLLLLLIGSGLSPVVMHVLTIPSGRERAAFWVYELTLLNLAITMMAVPFGAIIDAHQAMVLSAVRDFFVSCVQLAAVLLMLKLSGDKLITYAILMLAGRAGILAMFSLIVMRIFPASHPLLTRFRRSELRNIAGFAGWTSLTSLAWQLRIQGSIILLNVVFGPVVNAAFDLATRVAGYQQTLGGAIAVAARSATVSVHARGATESLKALVLITSKYTSLVMLLFLVPIQLEVINLLTLWLKEFPPLTPTFVRLAMIWVYLYPLSAGYHLAALARGNIGPYTIVISSLDAMILIAGVIEFFVLGLPPTALLVTIVASTVIQICFQAWYVGRQIDLPFSAWIWRLLRPVGIVSLLGLAAAWLPHHYLDAGLPRLLAAVLGSASVMIPATWFLALEPWERDLFRGMVQTFYSRARGRLSRPAAAGGGQV